MPQNYPFTGQQFTNDVSINESYPRVQYGGQETGALYFEDIEIAGAMYRVQNATYNRWTNVWLLINPALGAYGTVLLSNGSTQFINSPANTTPFSSWNVVATVDATGKFTGIMNPTTLVIPNATDFSKMGAFNVKNYGAKGDGVTDDYTAISAAIAAAPAGSTIFFPPGTYRISHPLQPSAQGQRFIGSGAYSTTLTYNPLTDTANFYQGYLIDGCVPGQAHGALTTAARNNAEVAFMTLDAQARNITVGYATGNYGGCLRTGDYWNVHDCLLYDGHYFHCFVGGWYNTIERNIFDGGDAFQDTLGGGGKFHVIRRNLWTAACSYNATLNGADHNAIDHVGGSLSALGYEGNVPTQGTIYEDNIILGQQQVIFEGSYDVIARNNQLSGGGNIYFQSDTRYGYSNFHQTKRPQIVGNVLAGSTSGQTNQPGNIVVMLERVASPNTGSTEQGGGCLIEGNVLEAPYTSGIIIAGDNDTTASYGGTRVLNNFVHNANASNTNSTNYTVSGTTIALNNAAFNAVGGWQNMVVKGNQFIDTRGTTFAPAIVVGNATTNFTPAGSMLIEGNVVSGIGTFGFTSPVNIRGIATSGGVPSSAWPVLRNNAGYNPQGQITAPTIPASGTFIVNTFGVPVDVYITGGTLTAITRKDTGGHTVTVATTAASPNLCHLEPGESIAITYSVVPSSWTWMGL